MSKGALLFAFNNEKFNYFEMAQFTAKRINHFLNLPVTVITDSESISKNKSVNFDKIICVEPDKSNEREYSVWINKGRYQAFDLSPYDETLLLDVDYVVNSTNLLRIFSFYDDFACHNSTSFLMNKNVPQEKLSPLSFVTLWATVIAFKKTPRVKQIFDCLQMIQNNYKHYGNLHGFLDAVFRNDHALTLAVSLANGHFLPKTDIIPWNLTHIGKNTKVYAKSDKEFNTQYTITYDNWSKIKIKKEYMEIKDIDFHIMNKENFVELMTNE